MPLPIVAVVGRPNVGKSTFVNRIAQADEAIVHEMRGVTRDRSYHEADWNGVEFKLVDTGGIEMGDDDAFQGSIRAQAIAGANEADVVVFLVDGKTGIGEPGGACATCPMNAYGSARDGGRGKACKNMRDIYLLRSGEYMPLLISLPPTSIKPFKEFLNRAFVYRRRATYGSLIQIGLKKENNGSNDYSVATFRLVRDFQGEELAQIRAYANGFKEQIKAINIQRALINEEQRANDCDYVIPESATAPGSPDGSYVVGEINGSYEKLPA